MSREYSVFVVVVAVGDVDACKSEEKRAREGVVAVTIT